MSLVLLFYYFGSCLSPILGEKKAITCLHLVIVSSILIKDYKNRIKSTYSN